MITDLEQIIEMEQRYRTTFINSLPGFKNLQLVGTIDKDGISNLSLFNSVFHIGASPPLLGMVFRPESYERDTLKNIMDNGQYTLNNVLPQWYENAHQTSARFEPNISEFRACGFTPAYIPRFKAPFVQESTVKIGMSFLDIMDIAYNKTYILVGEIVMVQMEDGLVADDGFVDHQKAGSVTVSGLDSYYSTNELGRLAYAKPVEKAKKV